MWWDIECLGTQLGKEVGHSPTNFRLLSSFDLGGLHYETVLIIRAMRLVGNFVINRGAVGRGITWEVCSTGWKFATIPVFALGPRKGTCEEPEWDGLKNAVCRNRSASRGTVRRNYGDQQLLLFGKIMDIYWQACIQPIKHMMGQNEACTHESLGLWEVKWAQSDPSIRAHACLLFINLDALPHLTLVDVRLLMAYGTLLESMQWLHQSSCFVLWTEILLFLLSLLNIK